GLDYGNSELLPPAPPPIPPHHPHHHQPGTGRNLNINVPESAAPSVVQSASPNETAANAILRLEVELRDKHALQHNNRRPAKGPRSPPPPAYGKVVGTGAGAGVKQRNDECFVPMEKVLDELLKKLEIEHVLWQADRVGHYYQVLFPLPAGDPCETTLHCLTELGIGVRANSTVSVLPCSVSYDGSALDSDGNDDEYGSLAALGLVENNAPNIVAAMLVSPLMGPVMSITFGTIIADRELVKVGFISLALGMFISILFGFIFGLILGTTEMPWGFGDFPTEEMKGRGNARSLWMGILWALTSGSGVAVALLQGSAGPLIGVAISASLLPPVVNCGLFWALACIWLIYEDIKIPHLKGEAYSGNSSYEFVYTNYIPTEFLINGIVSGLLTVINVICIFITAIIVLKIKEVAAPYTSSPDLRRFWETDIRTARTANRTTIRRKQTGSEADVMST
ncbi:hypothetical protein RP20_CCG022483, partial [Aedes albopictus]